MPIRISSIMGVSRLVLKEKGVYDSMIDFDSKLHIDPATLKNCIIPEFLNAQAKVANYFNDVLTIISHSSTMGDVLWRTAHKKLTFGEGLNSGLGYSKNGTHGSGIGPKMALQILTTVSQVVSAGVSDPKLFELVPILEENIGSDRISDMISIILKDEFLSFTDRISRELKVKIPTDDRGMPIAFIPRSILNDLPISSQWEDVNVAAAHNESVRGSLNSIIGKSWKKVAIENKKNDLKELLIKHPELLKELLAKYKSRSSIAYNFAIDHLGITVFDIIGPEAALDFPLDLKKYTDITSLTIRNVVSEITTQFKNLIENNGLVNHLYDGANKLRPERFPQLLFYSIADSYCIANNLDLNREINGGSGALDFKISRGLAKVNLEIKYSSNPKLVEGFTKQLKVYNDAERIDDRNSVYLILRINDRMDHKIREIREIIAERAKLKVDSPELVVVNADIKPSASLR
jgi:hypothetical protein